MEHFTRKITSMRTSIQKSIDRVQAAYPDLSKSDEVLSAIISLVDEQIGRGFNTQEEVDKAVAEGEIRYKNEIPPGYLDLKKDGSHRHRKLEIPRKYGDWILWSQIMKAVQTEPEKFSSIVFVTQDQKADWWAQNPERSGETLGPRYEMRQEIEAAGAKFYWQYTFQNFYKHLLSLTHPITPDQNAQLEEISNAERRTSVDLAKRDAIGVLEPQWDEGLSAGQSPIWNKIYSAYFSFYRDVKNSSNRAFHTYGVLKSWLADAASPCKLTENRGSPDILIYSNERRSPLRIIGIQIVFPTDTESMMRSCKSAFHKMPNTPLFGPTQGYVLIVLDEAFLSQNKFEEWTDAFIDVQGLFIWRGTGLSVCVVRDRVVECIDEALSIEEPRLLPLLKSL